MKAAYIISLLGICLLVEIRSASGITQPAKVVLPNGLTVITSEGNGSGVVAIQAMVRVSVLDESPQTIGIRNFTHLVMARGSTRFTGDQIIRAMEAVGGKLELTVSADCAEMQATVLCNGFEAALYFVADLLRNSRFDQPAVESVRASVLSQLKLQGNDRDVAYAAFKRMLYGSGLYAWNTMGTEAVMRGLTREQLLEFHSQFYVPNNTVLVIVGSLSAERVMNAVRQCFGDWEKRTVPERTISPTPELTLGRVIKMHSQKREGTVVVGFPAPAISNDDFPAMSVVNSLLGSGMSSRLFREVRERMGLVYQVTSLYPTVFGPGHIISYATAETHKMEALQASLLGEFTRLKTEPVTDTELEMAKRFLLGNNARAHSHNQGQAHYLAWYEALAAGYTFDTQFPTSVERVTTQDILRVANRYFIVPVVIILEPSAKGEQPTARE